MKRIIAILILLASTAHAQVWLGGTNEISGIVGPLIYTNFVAGQFRVTCGALDGGSPIDLSGDRVSLQVEDTRDGKLIVSNTCIRLDDYTYRGEGSLSASPASYTLKMMVYPEASPENFYPIYWASLTVTSAPSAGASVSVNLRDLTADTLNAATGTYTDLNVTGDLTIGGSLNVGESIEAIDSLARTQSVLRVGDTMTGPLTNEHGYYGNGGTLTGLNWSAISNAPSIPDLTDVVTNRGATINDEPITNGAQFYISSGGGLVMFTAPDGRLAYTNADGQVQVSGGPAHTGEWYRTYDDPGVAMTNVNQGAWTAIITNGELVLNIPPESVNQTRGFDLYRLSNTNVAWRASLQINECSPGGTANSLIRGGLGYMQGTGGIVRVLSMEVGQGAAPVFRGGYHTTPAGSRNTDTGGTASFPADANQGMVNHLIFPPFTMFIDFNGTNIHRMGVRSGGYDFSGDPPTPLWLYSKTNAVQSDFVGIFFGSVTTASQTNQIRVDNFVVKEGDPWPDP